MKSVIPIIAHIIIKKKNKVSDTNTYCRAKILLPLTMAPPTLKELSQNFKRNKWSYKANDPIIDKYEHQIECRKRKDTKYL